MSEECLPYITKLISVQLQHDCNTKINKAMNNSVAAYAPKHKTYLGTTSLDVRVTVTGSV